MSKRLYIFTTSCHKSQKYMFQGVIHVLTYSDKNCSTLVRTRVFQNDPNLCQQSGPLNAKGECNKGQLNVTVYSNAQCSGLKKSSLVVKLRFTKHHWTIHVCLL